MSECYLCDHSKVKATFTINTDRCGVECPSCGEYTISESVRSTIHHQPGWNQQKPVLAKAARRNFAADTPMNLITESDLLNATADEAKRADNSMLGRCVLPRSCAPVNHSSAVSCP